MATASAGYTLLDDFLPEMLQYCNGAPAIMLRIHLINSAIDLCNKALLLKKVPSPFQLEEGVHTYTLKYAQNRYRVLAVDNAKLDGSNTPLLRTTEKEMDSEFINWRGQTSTKPTRYWLTDDLNTIRVWPTPKADVDVDFTIDTVVTYKRGQIEVDEFIYEKWHEVIQAGALTKVLLIPEASWYSPDTAGIFALTFSRGVNEARKTTLTGTGNFPGRVMPQNYIVVGSENLRSGSWV